MKKVIVLLFLISSSIINAQSSEKPSEKKINTDFYIGLGASVQSEFALNDRLRNSGLAELNETIPELLIGLNVFGTKFSGDAEFGFFFSKNGKDNSENQNMGFTSRLRVHYNLVNKDKIAFTSGLNFATTGSEVDIYTKNNFVDLNNLGTLNNNHVSLKNQMFYVGPSVSLYLLKHKSSQIRVNLGYEFAFTNGKWKSDFASVNNTVKEIGNNRFLFGITLL
jgi:hypothetical protein